MKFALVALLISVMNMSAAHTDVPNTAYLGVADCQKTTTDHGKVVDSDSFKANVVLKNQWGVVIDVRSWNPLAGQYSVLSGKMKAVNGRVHGVDSSSRTTYKDHNESKSAVVVNNTGVVFRQKDIIQNSSINYSFDMIVKCSFQKPMSQTEFDSVIKDRYSN